MPSTPFIRDPDFPAFSMFFHHVTMPPLCWHFVPKVGPKTSQGAQKVPKRSPKAHFSVPKASLLGALATKGEPLILNNPMLV